MKNESKAVQKGSHHSEEVEMPSRMVRRLLERQRRKADKKNARLVSEVVKKAREDLIKDVKSGVVRL